MPQVSSRPPPYSIECSSFPPPIQAAAGPEAWAFQRAFESAREPIRWALLTTMLCWENDWPYHAMRVPRHLVQHAYDIAPSDLKAALDYILKYNVPYYMLADRDRRRHDLQRTGRVEEIETTKLYQEDFVRLYNEAVEPVKQAIASSIDCWTNFEDHVLIPRVSTEEVPNAYAEASDSLQLMLSWMLETGWDIGIINRKFFEEAKAMFHRASLNTATAHVELHAMNRLNGMY